MIWSTCWISRKIQRSDSLMISSIIQRLPRMRSGLFDDGFAGDVDFITSPELNASVDAPGDFGLNGQHSSLYPGTSGLKNNIDNLENVNSWDVLNDLDDLSDDPLGDDSMEAFINLDKFLNGNSFFDEEGNLTVPDNDANFPIPIEEAEVKPVITFAAPLTEDLDITRNFEMEQVPTTVTSPQTSKNSGKPSRKRPATTGSRKGVKTSLFEIPAVSILSAEDVSVDSELDHDYSSKRQRMASPSGNNSSGTMKLSTMNVTQNQSVPSTSSVEAGLVFDNLTDKHTIRRIKNNHASKRSREQRKQKFVDMDTEAEELVVKNQQLRDQIVELEKLAKEMKEILVAKMAGRLN